MKVPKTKSFPTPALLFALYLHTDSKHPLASNQGNLRDAAGLLPLLPLSLLPA